MESNEDIEHIFRRMAERFADQSDGAKRMLAMLVRVTLAYRDELVLLNEPPLTVGETQSALDAFMVVLRTQQFPEVADPRVKALVVKWLEELRKVIHN